MKTTAQTRTAYYIQYWITKTGRQEDGEPYIWKADFDSLTVALKEAQTLKEAKPNAYDIDIYSRQEQWIPDEDMPCDEFDNELGYWLPVENTSKGYDFDGTLLWADEWYQSTKGE